MKKYENYIILFVIIILSVTLFYLRKYNLNLNHLWAEEVVETTPPQTFESYIAENTTLFIEEPIFVSENGRHEEDNIQTIEIYLGVNHQNEAKYYYKINKSENESRNTQLSIISRGEVIFSIQTTSVEEQFGEIELSKCKSFNHEVSLNYNIIELIGDSRSYLSGFDYLRCDITPIYVQVLIDKTKEEINEG